MKRINIKSYVANMRLKHCMRPIVLHELMYAGIIRVLDLCQKTEDELMQLPRIRVKSVAAIKNYLDEAGLRLGMTTAELEAYNKAFKSDNLKAFLKKRTQE